jgi:hypothetical protein
MVTPLGQWTVTEQLYHLGKVAHSQCSVATDCGGGDSGCAAPCYVHPTTPRRGEDKFSSCITLHWGDGLLRNGSRTLGKRLTQAAVLPLIVLVVTVTVMYSHAIAIPPPCKGEDAFSSFITLHWGHGRG